MSHHPNHPNQQQRPFSFMNEDYISSSDNDDDDDDNDDNNDDDFDWDGGDFHRVEMRQADQLSRRLLAVGDDDVLSQDRILRQSLHLHEPLDIVRVRVQDPHGFLPDNDDDDHHHPQGSTTKTTTTSLPYGAVPPMGRTSSRNSGRFRNMLEDALLQAQEKARRRIVAMMSVAVLCVLVALSLAYFGIRKVAPPQQPVGPYQLLERQEGEEFFQYYDFYEGPDSVGSNGYNNYVSQATAMALGIVNVTYQDDELDVFGRTRRQRRKLQTTATTTTAAAALATGWTQTEQNDTWSPISEPFVYMSSASTPDGPRQSIRLEGKRRFNRGLFILDVRHMPNACGVWPAFWLTDEANWPINGEIDIVEGINYQTKAKTALHSTQGCDMSDIPLGTMTGGWDTAQGIPDKDSGVPDMTLRYAKNCFVYDPHQWLNQGCVAVDLEGGTIGGPLNAKGGGVYVLEWDPINRHIRSWVFTPHESMPQNLIDTIRTAHLPAQERTSPNPELWPLPYGYFSIGIGTDCPSEHFQRMRLVFNTAFCGSVAGNRYFLDCPHQSKQFKTCNEWIASEPDEMAEVYWKIRGVYVYERAWEAKMLD